MYIGVFQNQICTFVVYIQSWNNTQQLENASCQNKIPVSDSSWVNPCASNGNPPIGGGPIGGRPPAGGWNDAMSDPEIQNVSRTAVLLYEQSINSDVALRLLNVLQAQEQVRSLRSVFVLFFLFN